MIPKGLTSAEAAQKLKEHGYNELENARPKSIFNIALEVVKEPMFLLLISCGLLYIILGNYHEGIILLSTTLLIIFITFYQYQKTEKALDALKKLSSPRVSVVRDGKEQKIPGREVVPGDLIILNEGDRVGADGTIVQSQNMTVDESLLTGESAVVSKYEFAEHRDETGKIFSGTLVTQGKGIAIATETGIHTQFGKIGISLKSIEQDETRLQKEMKSLIRVLFIIGIGLSILVVLAFYFTKGNFVQSLLNGLAAAMAILPEEFPVVLTIFLALGAWRLSKNKVLTRRPSAIETLGSATVLCSDKTGTITQNKMEVVAIYNGTQIIQKKEFSDQKGLHNELMNIAAMASNEASVDPMENAIIESNKGLNPEKNVFDQFIKEYPLSKELLAMTMVRSTINGRYAAAKGAPEAIFRLCKIESGQRAEYMMQVNKLAEQGYRIIGVAAALNLQNELPEKQTDFDFRFLGLLALEDPVRHEVPQAIKECGEAGIKVIMITGDFPATAKSIGQQIGLPHGVVLTGDDLKKMSDDELSQSIRNVSIFARVVPEQKLRIVKALKKNGEVVAMTGDGVNDAPALKAADIGIAMGKKGTDVAREASSLVLLDDNFTSIVFAIRTGRRIFDNLQKAMSYIMAIHIPIIGLTLVPALFPDIPLLLMPLHIVFMELIIDPSCSVAFEYEQEEKDIMKRPPRKPDENFFGGRKIVISVLKGALLLSMVLIVYVLTKNEGHTEAEIRAITFSALIIGSLAFIMSSLSKTRSFLSVISEKNYAAIAIATAAIIVLIGVISVPPLEKLFSFEFPGFSHFISSCIAATIVLFILESAKFYANRKR